MKKTMMAALAALMLLPLGARADEEPQTLTIGDYESAVDGEGVYDGSYYDMAPTTFNVYHSGSQILYTAEDVADMAGKNITSVNYVFYHNSSYADISRQIKVYLQEVDGTAFQKNDKNKYLFFDFSTENLCVDTTFSESFDYEDNMMNHELKLNFSTPFYYEGTKSLLVTITFDGEGATDGSDYAPFYTAGSGYAKRAMTFCSDNNTFADFHDSEDWPVAGSTTGYNLDLPLTQFTYVAAAAPEPVEVRALTIDAVSLISDTAIVCDANGNATVKAAVTLTNSGNVDLNPGDEGYSLTLSDESGAAILATAAIDSVLAAGATKTIPVTFAVENAKSYTTAQPLWIEEGVTASKTELATIAFEEQRYGVQVIDEDGDGFAEDATIEFTTLTDECSTINLRLVNTGNMTAILSTVTIAEGFSTTLSKKNIAPNDTVAFSITANNYLPGHHEGNLTMSFFNEQLGDMVIGLVSNVVEADTVLTLGNYNGNMEEGTSDGCFQGSYYDRCPTTFYLKHTGSQILYTKDQLARMAGKGIQEMRFLFFNEYASTGYDRTINLWVEEIDDDAFARDELTSTYKFFDYTNAIHAITDLQFEGDFSSYIYQSGELVLPFDQVVNYSGDKNLLVTVTFDGEECCGSLDLGFFCNAAVTKRAMTYTDDSYSFADFRDTEDWPYANDGTGTALEQPVTRFFFGEFNGISINSAAIAEKTNDNATYNLAGQRVADSYQGIVIRNGKKYIDRAK